MPRCLINSGMDNKTVAWTVNQVSPTLWFRVLHQLLCEVEMIVSKWNACAAKLGQGSNAYVRVWATAWQKMQGKRMLLWCNTAAASWHDLWCIWVFWKVTKRKVRLPTNTFKVTSKFKCLCSEWQNLIRTETTASQVLINCCFTFSRPWENH